MPVGKMYWRSYMPFWKHFGIRDSSRAATHAHAPCSSRSVCQYDHAGLDLSMNGITNASERERANEIISICPNIVSQSTPSNGGGFASTALAHTWHSVSVGLTRIRRLGLRTSGNCISREAFMRSAITIGRHDQFRRTPAG